MFGKDKPETPDIGQLVTAMTETLQQMPQMIAASVATAMAEAQKAQAPEPKPMPAVPTPYQPPTEEELEGMTHSQRQDVLIKRIRDEVMKPVSEKLVQTEQTTKVNSRKQDFINYANSNPEMLHYQDEIKTVLQRQPELDPQDVFLLAKGIATEEKRAEVEKIIRPMPVEEEKPEDNIFSFFPTVPQRGEEAGQMSKEEGAEDAWDNVFGAAKQIGG